MISQFLRGSSRRNVLTAFKMPGGENVTKNGGSAGGGSSWKGPKQQNVAMSRNATMPTPQSKQHTTRSRVEMTRGYSDHPGIIEDPSSLPQEERRKYYACGSKFIQPDQLTRWNTHLESMNKLPRKTAEDGMNERLCLFKGDITYLEVDAIVNAANERLMGGGGVDGSIHRAAGQRLKDECRNIGFCPTGKAVVTKGYFLPANYIIHTVGPIGHHRQLLYSCYQECFDRMLEQGLRTIAFCCISTGIYGFPNEDAANIALDVTRGYLENYPNQIDLVIFCCFLQKDVEIYERLMKTHYFPFHGVPATGRKDSVNRDRKQSRSKSNDIRKLEESNSKAVKQPSPDASSSDGKAEFSPNCDAEVSQSSERPQKSKKVTEEDNDGDTAGNDNSEESGSCSRELDKTE